MNHDEQRLALKKVLGDGLKENAALRDYTTMRVGGLAAFFYEATGVQDLIKALHACFDNNIDYLVIGSGSNIIFSDAGFPGLVIHNIASNIAVVPEKSQIIADAGAIYARVVTEAASHELGGIEYWFGLPGTIGGATHNNAETWGHDMSEVVRQVTLLFPPDGDNPAEIRSVGVEWMRYDYRTSRLKSWSGKAKPIILTITLQLQRQRRDEIMRRMKEYKQGRWDLNQPKGVASAGSFFRNPGGASHAGEKNPPEASAGWLLEQVGAKNIQVGQAKVSSQHANFMTNLGDASAQDIYTLATDLKERVKEKFGVTLVEEVEYLGVWPKK